MQKLDHYLHNAQFVIRTDHKPLKYILDAPMQNKKIQLWSLSIAGYNCSVDYIKGTTNCCADLLSRIPDNENDVKQLEKNNTQQPIDIDDRTFEINTLNSNKFKPRKYASCQIDDLDDLKKPELELPEEIDIKFEQEQDDTITSLKKRLQTDNATKTEQERHIIIDDLVYFLSNADSDPVLRLYIPQTIKPFVIKQFHDYLGHMSLDKTYDTMKLKYYFPNMYREIHSYINKCVICQARSDKKSKPPVQETDIPPYPFAKIAVDLSGPYPETLSGNKYIVTFIDLYSGFPEAFAVPDKTTENIVHLLIEEIFPRYSCGLQLVSDNGKENISRAVKETLETLNIHHVTTSYYNPAGNSKCERIHRTLNDLISKKNKRGYFYLGFVFKSGPGCCKISRE